MSRLLRRTPLLAVAALTAGLSGSLVLLALLDATVLRPIPGVREADRLVAIVQPSLSYPAFRDFRSAAAEPASGIDGIASYSHRLFAFSTGEGGDERRTGVVVGGDYFGMLGVRPAFGRLLTAEDDRAGAPLAVVLSHSFWRERFGAADDLVGRQVRLNGSAFEVVGIASPAFRGATRERSPDFWITAHAWIENSPSTFTGRSLDQRSWSWLRTVARLAPDTTLDAARSRLVAEAERQESVYPNDTRDDFENLIVAPAALQAIGVRRPEVARTISFAIVGLVALLVVLAVSSAAHLFLARGELRRQELATRLALGAGRRRIVLLLLAEPVAAALVAVALALGLARGALRLLADQVLPGGVKLGELGLAIDARLALGGALLALAAGAIAGWLPTRQLLRAELGRSLGSARTVSHGSSRTRRALTAAQVAISLLLIASTALVSRALLRATAIDTGYRGERLGFVTLDAGLARLTPANAAAGYRAALAAVTALPEVESASLVGALPLDPGSDTESFTVDGYTPAEDEDLSVEVNRVGPNALSTLGVQLVAGREIEAGDTAQGEPVGVVSRRFAERYLAGREPLGATIDLVSRKVRVVGVAEDVRAHGPGEVQAPAIYLALLQGEDSTLLWPVSVVYRSRTAPSSALTAVARAAATAMPGVPVVPEGSFDRLLASALAPQRFATALFGVFSLVATVLAALGLFGLVAHAAAARTRELGLRAALGAAPAALVMLLVRSAFAPVAIGSAIGIAAALPLAFAARGLMVGLESLDLTAVAFSAVALAATAAFAAWLPARRSARLDPVAALRTE